MRLKDKVAIITGAGSGIGRAIALLFAAQGAKVLVADVVDTGGLETLDAIKTAGGEAHFLQVDVTNVESTQRMVTTALELWSRLDVLVNNAGIVRLGSVTETSLQDWDRVIDVDLKGVFLCSRASIPALTRGGGGAIVNIASVGGLVGPAGLAAYGSAKGGVINLTRQMAVDYGPQGVRVNAICPGTIPTPMHYAFYTPEEQEATLADWARTKPLRRNGTPEDIAYAAVYLASDEAGFVTGNILVVDGGVMASG
ncbi:MAG: glucose 1-dehydrogenase [Anaerolineales bacterium]|jgi:3-oxoacyl-[acyl-carrier protein] reductase